MAFFHIPLVEAQAMSDVQRSAFLDCIPEIESMKAWFKAAAIKAGAGDTGAMSALAESVFVNDPLRQAAVLEGLGALNT